MTVTFKNAPLVELIAELRWGENPIPLQPAMPVMMQGMGPALDQFFMRLGAEVYQHGFRRTERLVPPGFPVFPFQPVFRFRKDAADDNSVLFQAGLGLFSVNAVPPYRSWETVSTFVKAGVSGLLSSRSPEERDKPFTVLSLRYINAFGPKLTNGRPVGAFIKDVLGFEIQLPPTFSEHIKIGSEPSPHVQLTFTLKDGASMSFLIGDGTVNNEKTIIMDMTVSRQDDIAPNIDVVMAEFTSARSVMHSVFLDLIKPIHALLEPIEDKGNA